MHPKVLPRYINRSPRRTETVNLTCLSKFLEATVRRGTGKTTKCLKINTSYMVMRSKITSKKRIKPFAHHEPARMVLTRNPLETCYPKTFLHLDFRPESNRLETYRLRPYFLRRLYRRTFKRDLQIPQPLYMNPVSIFQLFDNNITERRKDSLHIGWRHRTAAMYPLCQFIRVDSPIRNHPRMVTNSFLAILRRRILIEVILYSHLNLNLVMF